MSFAGLRRANTSLVPFARLLLLLCLANAASAATTFRYEASLNAMTAGLTAGQFAAQKTALAAAATAAMTTAGGGSPRCTLATLAAPAPPATLRGLQIKLTVQFDAASAQTARLVLARFKPPALPAGAGCAAWLVAQAPKLVAPPPPPGLAALQSNGTHVLMGPAGTPWKGLGVNAVDEYKCGVCRGTNRLSQKETLRRLQVAIDCLGAQWVRYAIMDGQSPPNVYDGSMSKEPFSFIQDAGRLATLDAAVQLAAQKGIYFEIALWVSYTLTNPANKGPNGQPYGWPTAATAVWWRFIAARYKGQPHVFFGLLNEPQDNFNGEWDQQYTAAAQVVVNAIRSTGAKNLIAVGASRAWARYAEGFKKYPIVDSNWAAGVHFYLKPEEVQPAYDAYCKDHACIVEEFGPATDYGYTLNQSVWEIGFLKQHGLPSAGWMADEDCAPEMLATTNQSMSSCWDNRPLQLSPWGQAMKAGIGYTKACGLLS